LPSGRPPPVVVGLGVGVGAGLDALATETVRPTGADVVWIVQLSLTVGSAEFCIVSVNCSGSRMWSVPVLVSFREPDSCSVDACRSTF
jgi:hypothetical protein